MTFYFDLLENLKNTKVRLLRSPLLTIWQQCAAVIQKEHRSPDTPPSNKNSGFYFSKTPKKKLQYTTPAATIFMSLSIRTKEMPPKTFSYTKVASIIKHECCN
ncbi:MAG: hypothetical protein AYP45_04720 [Candidatus Brocadia carolinensis]|uniref:Uncharacterized protein n=1 Tax=Candidatus Brocadia carolinensis TaxID=1004156 RepID=A0A1V4AVT5_9BACT|nr:MAG: hypothetical protein AYP45_04720 [Candidatus Brocadia caroliniensis]